MAQQPGSRVAGAVRRLASVPGREDRLTHLEVLPRRPAQLRRVAGLVVAARGGGAGRSGA